MDRVAWRPACVNHRARAGCACRTVLLPDTATRSVRLPQRSCRISPATKWYEFNPALQTSAPIPQATIRELQRAKPKLIVLERNWTTFDEPNNIAISSGVTLLDDYPSAEAAAAGGTMGPTTPGRCGGLTRPLPEQGIARANDLLGMPAWNAR